MHIDEDAETTRTACSEIYRLPARVHISPGENLTVVQNPLSLKAPESALYDCSVVDPIHKCGQTSNRIAPTIEPADLQNH